MVTTTKINLYIISLLCILVSILYNNSIVICQESNNSENLNITTLYRDYQREKGKYLEVTLARLHESIDKDVILKDVFYSNDSLLFKKLKVYINPLLKLKPKAINYKFSDDIRDLIELDTINYDCVAGFYLDDKLYFTIERGYNDCDQGIRMIGGEMQEWCPGNYYFFQHYYDVKMDDCFKYERKVIKDEGFIFRVDGLNWNWFEIKGGKLLIYPSSQDVVNKGMLDRPNDFIRNTYQEEFIRLYAKSCPMSKIKK